MCSPLLILERIHQLYEYDKSSEVKSTTPRPGLKTQKILVTTPMVETVVRCNTHQRIASEEGRIEGIIIKGTFLSYLARLCSIFIEYLTYSCGCGAN